MPAAAPAPGPIAAPLPQPAAAPTAAPSPLVAATAAASRPTDVGPLRCSNCDWIGTGLAIHKGQAGQGDSEA